MGQRDLGFLLVPIVAFLALFFPSAAAPRRPEPGRAATAPAGPGPAATETVHRDAAALLREYARVAEPDTGTPRITAGTCLLATLPDPIDAANLSYTYDRYLDAIQRGMEAAGFLLDRFDIPWLDTPAAGAEPRFRTEPGRLLFRSRTPGLLAVPPAAVVFVVGETPTSGIHKLAFSKAIEEFSETCTDGATEPIRVLGPSFSGSAASLHALLQAWKQREFVIISGSATAIDSAALARDTNALFETTIAQDVDARNLFLGFVAQRERRRSYRRLQRPLRGDDEPTKVALLVESNTGFGSVAAQSGGACGGAGPSGDAIQEVVPCGIDLIRLPFPLHVSSLRVVARDTSAASAPAADRAPAPQALTTLDLRHAPAARTVLPLTSAIEPASIEIVLSKLLETLEEEHVRYIGLVATDIQDRVFLSQQIRHHLPNSVLFMFSSDLLYLHPDVAVDLRGAQIVTSYPLFSENVEWTPSADPAGRLLFSTHTTQGVYNATLALLGLERRMQEYGYPFDAGRPNALWLSVIGNDGIWPVRVLGEADTRDMLDRPVRSAAARMLSMPHHPWIPTLVFIACIVPALFVVTGFSPGARRSSLRESFSSGFVAQLFGDTIYRTHRLPRRLYLLACAAALASIYLLTLTIYLLPLLASGSVGWKPPVFLTAFDGILTAGFGVMLAMLAFLARLVTRSTGRDERGREHLRWTARIGVAIVSFGLVAHTAWLCWRWIQLTRREPADAVLLYLRSADLRSGVSPLLPLVLLCGAAVIWALSALRRLRLLEGPNQYAYAYPDPAVVDGRRRWKRPQSFLGLEGASFEGVPALEQAVFNAVGRRSAELPRAVLAAILVFLLLAWGRLFGPRNVPTPEGTAFDTLFAIGFLVVYAGLALSFVRFVYIWRRLLQLLKRLAWHPTVKAYARLREKVPGKPKINLTSSSQVFTALEFSVDRAGQLVALARELVASHTADRKFTIALQASFADMECQVRLAERAFHAALDAEARGDWRTMIRQRTRAEKRLSLIARTVTTLLRPAWRLPATDAPARGSSKPDELDWFALGEDFLTSRVAALLSHVVPQLQNLIVCVTAGLMLMLLAVTSYPFQPRQLLLLFNTTVILAAVSATFVVFVQMERETILSVLSDSEPGHVGWNRDFISRIAVYIGLPIISLMGAQFPEVAQQLFTWTSSFLGTH